MRTAKSSWRRATRVLGSLLGLCPSGALGQTLKEVMKFDLPGPSGKRFDYLTIDPDHFPSCDVVQFQDPKFYSTLNATDLIRTKSILPLS